MLFSHAFFMNAVVEPISFKGYKAKMPEDMFAEHYNTILILL